MVKNMHNQENYKHLSLFLTEGKTNSPFSKFLKCLSICPILSYFLRKITIFAASGDSTSLGSANILTTDSNIID
jgi:hypothetical protein